MAIFKRLLPLTVAAFAVALVLAYSSADESDKPAKDGKEKSAKTKPLTKAEKAAAQKALEPFNSYVGGWRGAGQVRRGSAAPGAVVRPDPPSGAGSRDRRDGPGDLA